MGHYIGHYIGHYTGHYTVGSFFMNSASFWSRESLKKKLRKLEDTLIKSRGQEI